MSRNMSAQQSRSSKNPKETYTVQKFLGNGAFGKAYLIKSNETQINYVMKRICLNILDEKERKNVINEGLLLKRIDHPNIIKFKECFKNLKPVPQMNIIMEYASGGDINQILINQIPNHFEENLLIDWLSQICNALQYIHNKNIIHRDIKPENIFLNNLGQIKLGDFGISKNLETMKMACTFIGSINYIAPELINNNNYSFEADIWSLGVTFYELMTFKKPFRGEFPAICLKIVNDDVEPITDFYSKEFRNLIYKMLSKDPSKRPKAKDIIKMSFVRNRILSYLQEKKFNLKDSFNLIKNYQKKKNQKLNKNYHNNNNMIIKNNFIVNNKIINDNNTINNNNNNNIMNPVNYNSNKKIKLIDRNNNSNNINTINNNDFKLNLHLKSNKELDRNRINQRYNKIFNDKDNTNEKMSNKDNFNNFRYSMQIPEKRNKINLSKTKVTNTPGNLMKDDKIIKTNGLFISQQNQNISKNLKFNQLKNDKKDDNIAINKITNSNKEETIRVSLDGLKNLKNVNTYDKDSYDFHRQMNIFSSILKGVKTDEQIEEENNILLNYNDNDNIY